MKLIDKISYKIKQEIQLIKDDIQRIKYDIDDMRLRIQLRRLKKDLDNRQPRRLNKFKAYRLYRKLLRNAPAHAVALNHNSVTDKHIGDSVSFAMDGWNAFAVHYSEAYTMKKEHEYIVNVENKNLRSFSFTGDRARKIYERAKQYCR